MVVFTGVLGLFGMLLLFTIAVSNINRMLSGIGMYLDYGAGFVTDTIITQD